MTSAVILAWLFAFGPDARVFTLAPGYRQVETNLWGDIKRMFARAEQNGKPLGGHLYETAEYKLGDNWYATGFSVKDPARVHGIHGPNDLLVLDDAHGIPQEIFDGIENMMSGGNTHILMLFNPVALTGETYACAHAQKHLWHNIPISYADTPNGKANAVVHSGMLLPKTVAEWALKYGVDSNFYRVKVDAQYPRQESDTLIPLDWVEQAMVRDVPPSEAHTIIGQDVARFGDDESVRAELRGRRILPLEVKREVDTMQTADEIDVILLAQPGAVAYVDEIGVGAGVVDRERQRGRKVVGVNAAAKPWGVFDGKPAEERFVNLRSQLWWMTREALNPANPNALALPRDPDLQAQLSGIKWTVNKSGKVEIESKDRMKARLGCSPDRADAVCLAVWGAYLAHGDQDAAAWATARNEDSVEEIPSMLTDMGPSEMSESFLDGLC